MKIFITLCAMVGSYFAASFVIALFYQSNFDVPGIAVSPAVCTWATVLLVGIITWAKVD